MISTKLRGSDRVASRLRGGAAVGGAIVVIGHSGGGGGGVPADDQFQTVRRFRDERNHEAAVEVPRPDVVDLKESRDNRYKETSIRTSEKTSFQNGFPFRFGETVPEVFGRTHTDLPSPRGLLVGCC